MISRFFVLSALVFVFFQVVQLHANAAPIELPFGHDTPGISHLPDITLDPKVDMIDPDKGETAGVLGFGRILTLVTRYSTLLLRSIALFALFIAGYQLVSAQDAATEQMAKEKMTVMYLIAGLLTFWLAGEFVTNYLYKDQGQYILTEDEAQLMATETARSIKAFLNYFLSFSGAGAILMLVVSSVRMMINPGTDDSIEKEKKLVGYTAVGIIVIGLADTLVNTIFFPNGGYGSDEAVGVNVSALNEQLQGISNYALGFLGAGSLVSLILGGVMMVVTFGNEDTYTKVKTTTWNIVLGFFLTYSAYTIVATLLRTFLAG